MYINNELFQFRKFSNVISSEFGIITSVGEVVRFNSDPHIYAHSAINCDTFELNNEYYAGKSGGCGFENVSSFFSAIGEGVERYCPTFYDKNELIKSSYNNLINDGYNAILPQSFSL